MEKLQTVMHVGRKFSSVATPSTYIGIWKNAKPFLRGKEQLHSSYTLQKQLYSIHPSILPVSSAYSFQGRWESKKLANESNCCMPEIFTQTKQKLSIGQTLVSQIFFSLYFRPLLIVTVKNWQESWGREGKTCCTGLFSQTEKLFMWPYAWNKKNDVILFVEFQTNHCHTL